MKEKETAFDASPAADEAARRNAAGDTMTEQASAGGASAQRDPEGDTLSGRPPEGDTQTGLKKLQNVNLQMIHIVDDICRRYHLTYYALGGTLLGAVRHGGFIPWDDDVDLGMPRPDYEKFIRIAGCVLPARYRLRTIRQNDDYRTYMVKLEDTGVRFYREFFTADGTEKRVINAWIDIMPIDGAPGDPDRLRLHLKRISLHKKILAYALLDKCMGTSKKRSALQQMLIRFGLRTGCYRLLPVSRLHAALQRVCRTYRYEDAPLLGNSYGIYGRREFVRREVFGTPARLPFEDMQIACPAQYRQYLRHVYGDYMKLPPESARAGHEITFADGIPSA